MKILKEIAWKNLIFPLGTQFCVIFQLHAVSNYKKRSYKTQRWILGKIQDSSVGQFKFKNHIKELKNRQRSDFQSKEPSTFTFLTVGIYFQGL